MTTPDPRLIPYERGDGWAEASRVHPDPDRPTGWLCPGCGRNAIAFYGTGPQFNKATRQYEPPDTRVCLDCFKEDHAIQS